MSNTTKARNLRTQSTDAERTLWRHLRSRHADGYKFRRQHPIGPYIADFACPEQWLIIELDGSQHMERTVQDRQRTTFLESQGFRVLRFWDNDVLKNTEGVLTTILIALDSATAHRIPSPKVEDPKPGEGKRARVSNALSVTRLSEQGATGHGPR